MRQELKEIAEQVAAEWETLFDHVNDSENLARLAIHTAIQAKITEYAIASISQKAADAAEEIAEKAVSGWVKNGEFTAALPDAKVKRQIEKIFLESETWPEHVLSAAKLRLASIHRMTMVNGASAALIAAEFKITVSEAERLIEKAQDHAEDVRNIYKAFWG